MTTPVFVSTDGDSRPRAFAAQRIRQALADQGIAVAREFQAGMPQVRLAAQGPDTARLLAADGCAPVGQLGRQAHAIRRGGSGAVWVVGGDAAGAMYGGLEVAEQLAAGTRLNDIANQQASPRFAFRGMKFNLPWMSYRRHESLDLHSDTVRDLGFWQSFLDMMAQNRLNVLSLWNLHPFHLMIRPRNFPEACEFDDKTLADWQTFWKSLMRMAHDRAVQFHLFYWNIFVSPAFAKAHNVARYSIDWDFFGDGDRSELVARYNRECVTQLIDEYPDLDGLGVAMSERMGGMTPQERGQWVLDTIVAGIKAAKRPVQFNLRIPHSANTGSGGSTNRDTEQLGRRLLEQLDLPSSLWTEIKFNWSHGHSTPKLCLIHGGRPSDVLWNPPPTKYRILWQVRNEDFFVLRWGDPQFVREHIRRNGLDGVGGYFIGSECYIPAKDYITRPDARVTWKYAFERQWLFYKLWGRLLYDPATPDSVFEGEYERRCGKGTGPILLAAMAHASRVPQRIATFVGFTWDHTLYTEGLLAGKEFLTLDRLRRCKSVDADWMGIEEYAKTGAQKGRLAPPAVADQIEADAQEALKLVEKLDPSYCPLAYEVADIRAWAYLGLYFAGKIRAAVALGAGDKARALTLLEAAVKQWDKLVATTDPLYRPIPLEHLGKTPFSWKGLSEQVKAELRHLAAGGERP
jgi:hypothetical protein